MNLPAGIAETQPYVSQLLALAGQTARQLTRAPTAPYRSQAVQRLGWQSLWLIGGGSALVVILMFTFDAAEIAMMPPRKSPGLWPFAILTDFGKDDYVLAALALAAIIMAIAFPLLRGPARGRLLKLRVGRGGRNGWKDWFQHGQRGGFLRYVGGTARRHRRWIGDPGKE